MNIKLKDDKVTLIIKKTDVTEVFVEGCQNPIDTMPESEDIIGIVLHGFAFEVKYCPELTKKINNL